MQSVQSIIQSIEKRKGSPLNADEGVFFGDPARSVSTALVTWMATPTALQHAADISAELVITHESLYYPYAAESKADQDLPPGWKDWPTNKQRRELMEKHELTVLRVHGSADRICIFDRFAADLGLGPPVVHEESLLSGH